MTNRRYVAGRAHEYRVANNLRKEGWTVLRTAGSHGEFDLIAIKASKWGDIYGPWGSLRQFDGEIKLIQCKAGKSAKNAIKAAVDSDIKRWEGLYSVTVEVV